VGNSGGMTQADNISVPYGQFDDPVSQQISYTQMKSGRILELDGLRGIAILSVVLLHYVSDSAGGEFGSFLYRFKAAFRLGWSGVDLFFVLSGFLIGGILLNARESPSYFKTFYARRAFRILPIYFTWLALYPVTAAILSRWSLPEIPVTPDAIHKLPLYIAFIQSYVALPHMSLGWYWLAPTWSLAIEEQFYLVSAPLVRFLDLRKLLIVLLATIAVSPFLRILLHSYILPICRSDALAIGIILAMAWKDDATRAWVSAHSRALYVTLVALAAPLPIFIKWFPNPETRFAAIIELQWVEFFFAVLVLVVLVDRGGFIARIARWKFLREMGRLSYCMYIINLAILGLFHAIILRSYPSIGTVRGVIVTIVSFAALIGIAEISAKFFEGPLLRIGHRFRYSKADRSRVDHRLDPNEAPTKVQ
jgi:peptidoglycan/LPS O-acetylase OafA/YrhL